MERKIRLIDANELPVFTEIDEIIGTENGTEAIVTHWVQVDFITNAPTVEAIPIEWIEKQIEKTTDINNKDELDLLYAGHISYLIKLWNEENEKRR